jgi:hypothetical protein
MTFYNPKGGQLSRKKAKKPFCAIRLMFPAVEYRLTFPQKAHNPVCRP